MDRKIEQSALRLRPWMLVVPGSLVLLLLIGFAVRKSTGSELRLDAASVSIGVVEHAPFQEMVAVDGSVQPMRTVIVDALIGGKVARRFVDNGTVLAAGDSILLLENSDLQLDILNRETAVFELITNIQFTRNSLEQNKVSRLSQLADVEFQHREAEREFAAISTLFADSAVARQEFERAQNTVVHFRRKASLLNTAVANDSVLAQSQIRQMEVSLEQAQKNLELMRSKLEDLVVRAPIDGQLSGFSMEVGQLIGKGENIGQLDVLEQHKVTALVGESFNARVAVGQAAHVELNKQRFELLVDRVYPTITNNQFAVDLLFPGSAPKDVKRGQNLVVRLELSGMRECTVVPRGGFFQSTGGQWIYVLQGENGPAVKRPLRIGRQNPTHYEVLDGLQPGERVITSGYHTYSDYETLWLE